MPNGEKAERHWPLYSPSTGRIFCFVCKLFSSNSTSSLGNKGYDSWDHINRLSDHECSVEHRQALTTYSIRVSMSQTLDKQLTEERKKDMNYWREVLNRVVSVVRFLTTRGLALRGTDETFGSDNNGNYLGCLELLAEYDPFLASHIGKYASAGRGHASYLSSTTCEEFVNLMSNQVKETILNELKAAKYYSFSVDSTPDKTHLDQLTFTLRYVMHNGYPIERFVKFVSITSHTGQSLFEVIKSTLCHDMGILFEDCRGQTFDNASNMAGIYSGVQAHVLKINDKAVFIPCMAHSLNLSGTAAADSCTEAVTFFGVVQKIFLSSSPYRWKLLCDELKTHEKSSVPKRLSDTRWSARADAINSMAENFEAYKKVSQTLADDSLQKKDTQSDAESLVKAMNKLETCFMTVFWNTILKRINQTSKTLQSETIDLCTAVALLKSLHQFLSEQRSKEKFTHFCDRGQVLCDSIGFSEKRLRRPKRTPDDTSDKGITFNIYDKFRIQTYFPILDALMNDLNRRIKAYSSIDDRFAFLRGSPESNSLSNMVTFYSEDLDSFETVAEEWSQWKYLVDQLKLNSDLKVASVTPSKMMAILKENKFESSFPNVYVILRIYLTIPVTNCAGERSFSHMKRIKSALRSTMGQDRLNSLTIMSIESEIVKSIDFSDLIDSFSKLKIRRRQF